MHMNHSRWGARPSLLSLLCVACCVAPGAYAEAVANPVSFNREVRHILADKCFACHGPDNKSLKGGLRLDIEDEARKTLTSGHVAVVPGHPDKSELIHRITASNPEDHMPPAEAPKQLTQEDIEIFRRWITEGALWEQHWAFVPPKRPEVPESQTSGWGRNAIDAFILSRLESEGLTPSDSADKNHLIRRVTLDLTGLPPSPAEVTAFLADESPEAYENAVDRLFKTPAYAEQMTRHWLDLARYSDTNGYHIDNERTMWPWRDWVIQAYGQNMPFDQFTIEQLAGDLLPDPTQDQLIASGFNRNHMINFEGGIIPEEYRVAYVVDRTVTTSQVWMGLTMNCGQCHNHKYDPISQRDFYRFFAYFNNIAEEGSDGREGNAKPLMKVPTPEQRERQAAVAKAIQALRDEMNGPMTEIDAAQAAWEAESTANLDARWTVLTPSELRAEGGATLGTLEDASVLARGENPAKQTYVLTVTTKVSNITAFRLEALPDPSLPEQGTGRAENANFVLSEFEVEYAPAEDPDAAGRPAHFTSANADHSQENFDIALAIDGKPETGWASEGYADKQKRIAVFVPSTPIGFPNGTMLRVRLRHESEFAGHAIGRFRLSVTNDDAMSPSTLGPWYSSGPYLAADGTAAYTTVYEPETQVDLSATYEDGRAKWSKVTPAYEEGTIQDLAGEVCATYLYRTVHAPTARTMQLGLGSNDALKVWLNGNVVLDNNVQRGVEADQDKLSIDLVQGENRLLLKVVNYGNLYAFYFKKRNEQVGDIPFDIEAILSVARETRPEADIEKLRTHYRRTHLPEWPHYLDRIAKLEEEAKEVEKAIPTTMIMQELEAPRETFVLARGEYDQPGDKVEPGVPEALGAFPEGRPNNRLGLAEWLVSPGHPLTARVVVNRYWQRFFGTGIVKTLEDFGVQGEWPSHPELLDWLSTELVESGWDLQHLQRLIVSSATYRQHSGSTPELLERDPNNRLLARGPRYRLDGEIVRDNALAISGLLVAKTGGPSVSPYHPAGLWEAVAYGAGFTAQKFVQDHGENLYRRSMYTFWKRQSPPAGMMLFDAPNRETCTVIRARSNTPLQALALMNDTQYVEAARALAQRMMIEGGAAPEERIGFAFFRATARMPQPEEIAIIRELFEAQWEVYKGDVTAAEKLLSAGESPRDSALDPAELAAWCTVANLILNLDETVTKS